MRWGPDLMRPVSYKAETAHTAERPRGDMARKNTAAICKQRKSLTGNQLRQHLELGLPASRAMKKNIPIA